MFQLLPDSSIFDDSFDDSVQEYIKSQKASSTVSKDKTDENRFNTFCRTLGEQRKIEDIPAVELDRILCKFFMSAKTLKGELYEPDSLTSFFNSFQRVLETRGSAVNLKSDETFARTRSVLKSRRKELVKLGKGNQPNATRSLSASEVDILFQNEFFGASSALNLQRAVWWKITTHFGHRTRDEASQMEYGDIAIGFDNEKSLHYLIWDTERSTKTRDGARPMGHRRAFNPKAYEVPGSTRCPVYIYRCFISHRPESMKSPNSPLFLQCKYNIDYNKDQIWYYSRGLGKNSIGKFLSEANKVLPCESSRRLNANKVANHSARKTSVTMLLNANVDPNTVKQLSGHKKTDSLSIYQSASDSQQFRMSSLLSNSDTQPVDISNRTATPQRSLDNQPFAIEKQMPLSIQKQLMEEWNTVSTFQGATFSNCAININFSSRASSPHSKRRRVIFEEDSQE